MTPTIITIIIRNNTNNNNKNNILDNNNNNNNNNNYRVNYLSGILLNPLSGSGEDAVVLLLL